MYSIIIYSETVDSVGSFPLPCFSLHNMLVAFIDMLCLPPVCVGFRKSLNIAAC